MRSRIAIAALVGALLIIVPLAYSMSRLSDSSYWSSAMSGWFATIMGIVAGVPFALWISRWQQLSTEAAQSQREGWQKAETLRLLRHRIHHELQYNLSRIEQLVNLMTLTQGVARVDHWRWVITIVESFEFDAHEALSRSTLVPPESLIDYASIDNAYRELRRIFHRAHQSAAAHDFYYGYQGNESSANWQLSEFHQHVIIVKSAISMALRGAGEDKEAHESYPAQPT
jgi:hypothetical protein